MRLVEQWREIERGLPADWGDARLLLTVVDEKRAGRAAALLGPINPGRGGKQLRLYTARGGAGHRPDLIRRLLARLDTERIGGELTLVSSAKPEAAAPREVAYPALATSWDAELAGLPADWSDAYAEVDFRSSDHLDRAALLLSPVNPARFGGKPGFRFRTARRFGYGVSPEMAHRCFERLDAEGIRGTVRILRALSDTRPAQTQGPVWYVGGKPV
jgi:hypothetical protein